ncbi:hypothetical protein F5B19DRAFT_494491 [Rostrohypoxylon terebratum]|nr:hypothetical protein F5B19DRAFT_494491 [Rostrohypoxylon terebratum]
MEGKENQDPFQEPSRPQSGTYYSPTPSLTQSSMSRATTATENGASASASSRTTYQASSMSEDTTQNDDLVMPFLSAPRNSPVSLGEQTAKEVEYEESLHDASHTIEKILGTYANQSSMANLDSSPEVQAPLPTHQLRRKKTQDNLANNPFRLTPFPGTPKDTSRGHKRSKHVLSISPRGSPLETPTPKQPLLPQSREGRRTPPNSSLRYDTSPPEGLNPFVTMRPSKGRDITDSLRHVGKLQLGSSATFVENSPATGTPASHLPSTGAYMDLRSHADDSMDQTDCSGCNSDWLTIRDSAETSEWCTTTGLNSEAGFNGRSEYDIVKETGSSVAPNSHFGDQNPFCRPLNVRSRPRLLQHSTSENDQNNEYEQHYMTGSNRTLMLPKSQRSVTEGLRDEYPQASGEGDIFSSAIRKVSAVNPFLRQDSSRHNMTPAEKTIPLNFTGRRRYEFRDSMTTLATQTQSARISNALSDLSDEGIEMKPLVGGPSTAKQFNSGHLSIGQSSSKQVEVSPTRPDEIRFVDIDYPHRPKRLRKTSKEIEEDAIAEAASHAQMMSSRSKFGFSLIPLDEAQRINKKKRETGETDETESSFERQRRMENPDAIRLVPLTPAHMPEPTKRCQYPEGERDVAPRLSIDFSPSSVSYRDALRNITPPFSATTPTVAQPRPARLRETTAADHEASPSPAAERSWMERVKTTAIRGKNAVQRKFTELTVIHHEPVENDSQMSLEELELATEPFLSGAARARRHRIFVISAIVSMIFPFVAILVMAGVLRGVLLWYTEGEVSRLTIYQRNYIRNTFLVWLCAIVIITPTLIAVFVKRS